MKIQALLTQLTMIAMMTFIGCSTGVEEEAGQTEATFLLAKVRTYETREVSDATWSMPIRMEMTLTTCMTEALYGKNIIGQKFEVTGENLEVVTESDDKGCIYWQDAVSYDYLSPESEIVVKRTITGLGDFQGEKEITLLVNPWNKTVVDSAVKKLDSVQFSASRAASIKTLNLDRISIKFFEEEHHLNHAKINAQISFEPKMTRLTASGEMASFKNIRSGEFVVTATLYEERNGNIEAISNPEQQAIAFDNGKVEGDFSFTILKTPSTDSNSTLKLGLRVVPNRGTAPKSLTDIEGFMTLRSDLRADSGTFMAAELPGFSFNKAFALSSNKDAATSDFGFSIEDLKVYFAGYLSAHQATKAEKNINANYTVCLKNKLTKQVTGEMNFKVTILNDSGVEISDKVRASKMNGCITASFDHLYNLNAKRDSNYIKHTMRIEGIDGMFQGFIREREFFINPWETGSLFAHTTEGELPPTNPENASAELYVPSFSLTYRSNDESKYRLNENMDMSFVKIYRAEFTPYIDRGHMLGKDKSIENLYSGSLKMRLMILAPKSGSAANLKEMASIPKQRQAITNQTLENYTFITGAEREVKIDREGKVRADFDLVLNSNNLKYMTARTYAVVELSSSDDQSMKSVIFSAPVMLANTGYSVSSVNENESLQTAGLSKDSELSKLFAKIDSVQKQEIPTSNWKMKSFDLFEKLLDDKTKLTTLFGLNSLTYSTEAVSNAYQGIKQKKTVQLVTESEFEMIMNLEKSKLNDGVLLTGPIQLFSGKNKEMNILRAKLCKFFYQGKGEIKTYNSRFTTEDACNAAPQKYLSIKGMKFVQEITKQPVRSQGSVQKSLNFSTNNNSDVSGRWSEFWGWRSSWGFKVNTFGLDAIGLSSSAGFDVNYGQSWSNNKGQGESVSFGESNRLETEETVLNFEAKTRSCVMIKALNEAQAFRLCEAQDREEELSESWYFMTESWRRLSYIADPGTENDLRLFKVIRGQTKFAQFKNLIEASNNQLFLTSKKGRSELNQYMSSLFQSDEGDAAHLSDANFPGIIE